MVLALGCPFGARAEVCDSWLFLPARRRSVCLAQPRFRTRCARCSDTIPFPSWEVKHRERVGSHAKLQKQGLPRPASRLAIANSRCQGKSRKIGHTHRHTQWWFAKIFSHLVVIRSLADLLWIIHLFLNLCKLVAPPVLCGMGFHRLTVLHTKSSPSFCVFACLLLSSLGRIQLWAGTPTGRCVSASQQHCWQRSSEKCSSAPSQRVWGWIQLPKAEVSCAILGAVGWVSCQASGCHFATCRHLECKRHFWIMARGWEVSPPAHYISSNERETFGVFWYRSVRSPCFVPSSV